MGWDERAPLSQTKRKAKVVGVELWVRSDIGIVDDARIQRSSRKSGFALTAYCVAMGCCGEARNHRIKIDLSWYEDHAFKVGIEGYQLMEGLDALVGNCTVRPMMAIEGDWLINHEYKRTQFTLMGGDQLRRSEKEAAKRVEKAEAEEKKQAEKGKGKGRGKNEQGEDPGSEQEGNAWGTEREIGDSGGDWRDDAARTVIDGGDDAEDDGGPAWLDDGLDGGRGYDRLVNDDPLEERFDTARDKAQQRRRAEPEVTPGGRAPAVSVGKRGEEGPRRAGEQQAGGPVNSGEGDYKAKTPEQLGGAENGNALVPFSQLDNSNFCKLSGQTRSLAHRANGGVERQPALARARGEESKNWRSESEMKIGIVVDVEKQEGVQGDGRAVNKRDRGEAQSAEPQRGQEPGGRAGPARAGRDARDAQRPRRRGSEGWAKAGEYVGHSAGGGAARGGAGEGSRTGMTAPRGGTEGSMTAGGADTPREAGTRGREGEWLEEVDGVWQMCPELAGMPLMAQMWPSYLEWMEEAGFGATVRKVRADGHYALSWQRALAKMPRLAGGETVRAAQQRALDVLLWVLFSGHASARWWREQSRDGAGVNTPMALTRKREGKPELFRSILVQWERAGAPVMLEVAAGVDGGSELEGKWQNLRAAVRETIGNEEDAIWLEGVRLLRWTEKLVRLGVARGNWRLDPDCGLAQRYGAVIGEAAARIEMLRAAPLVQVAGF